MKRFLYLLALPYVVTVTDIQQCHKVKDGEIEFVAWDGNCLPEAAKRYHLSGFQDCISSSTAQCDYMYDIASGLNMQYEKRVKDHPCHDLTVDQCEDIMTDRLEIQKLKDSK